MEKDYYSVLGVSRGASKDEINKAYRKLAKKYHPDVNSDPGSQDKFKEISAAYSVLGDDRKRSQYDQFGSSGGSFEGFNFDFSGFEGLNDLFGDFFGGGSRSKGSRKVRGNDLLYQIEIGLEDVSSGLDEVISLSRFVSCDGCSGRGYVSDGDVEVCSSCDGRGVVSSSRRTPFGVFQTSSSCRSCRGVGKRVKNACKGCKGACRLKKSSSISVKVPAGVETGHRLRLVGEGDASEEEGGVAGDLYVQVFVKDHKFFERDGRDLFVDVGVDFGTCVLGGEISVPTLVDGDVSLKIPSGTQTGSVFRMKGKGLPSVNSSFKGDQKVRVVVEVPKNLSKEQKELVKSLNLSDSSNKKKKFGLFS